MKLPEIDVRTFYLAGMILFAIGLLGTMWSLSYTWNNQNIGSKVASISNLVFQLFLIMFFHYLWKTSPKPIPKDQQEELNKLVQEYSQCS